MCGGALRTLYDPTPATADEGFHPPLLVDENGRLYVRLADKLSSLNDSVTAERGTTFGVGTHRNAWAAVAVAALAVSAVIDLGSCSQTTIMGTVSAAGVGLVFQGSQDGVNFYSLETVTISAAGDYGYNRTFGCRYIRLRCDTACTISATVAAKG